MKAAMQEAVQQAARAAEAMAALERKQKVLEQYKERVRSYIKEGEEADKASKAKDASAASGSGETDRTKEGGSSCSFSAVGSKESGPTRTSGVSNTLGTSVVEGGEFDLLGIELDPDIIQSLFGTLSPSAGLVDFDGGIF